MNEQPKTLRSILVDLMNKTGIAANTAVRVATPEAILGLVRVLDELQDNAIEAIVALIADRERLARLDELTKWEEFLNSDYNEDVKWISRELKDRIAELQHSTKEDA